MTQEPIRLSKRMAELGLCSRREADSYIEQGWVKVNGNIAVLGQKVLPNDRIDLAKNVHAIPAALPIHPNIYTNLHPQVAWILIRWVYWF